jgi:hypothetical protein
MTLSFMVICEKLAYAIFLSSFRLPLQTPVMPHYNSHKILNFFLLVQTSCSIKPYYFLKIFCKLHHVPQHIIFHQDNLQSLINYIESMARVKS